MQRRVRARAALVAVGLGLGLVLGEAGLRVASPIDRGDLLPLDYNRPAIRRIADDDAYYRFDRSLGWTLAPSERRRSAGAAYRTNAAGLRAEREFARSVRQDGATPVVVVFSGRIDLESLPHHLWKIYQPLLDWLAREEIPTIDVAASLAREASELGPDDLLAEGGHYDEDGNQVAAETLIGRLPGTIAATCGES